MENSTAKPAINTLEEIGAAIGKEWKAITKGDKARFTQYTKADGFDMKLGKLMVELKAEGSERISSQRLKDCSINEVDKRRRAEAMWFVENEAECREFIAKSKRGFTSLTALQAAMYKAAKAAKAETEAKPETTEGETVDKSNVGPNTEGATVKVTKQVVFDKLIAVCKANDIDLLDIAEMLMEVDTVSEAEETQTKVAA
jgi:hypothetical protein